LTIHKRHCLQENTDPPHAAHDDRGFGALLTLIQATLREWARCSGERARE
jgi:hypothetical protein